MIAPFRLALTAAVAATVLASVAPADASAATYHLGVRSVDYNLGARAFTIPGLQNGKHHDGPMELVGRVHYPAAVTRGTHPLVLMMPGYWTTCADATSQAVVDDPNSSATAIDRAEGRLNQWPCPKGVAPLPSHYGYDYLARVLAARGDVVVSISANGANAIDSYHFQGDEARVALISRQLQIWQQFVVHGRGPLARVLPHGLEGHVDMRDVGLLGHSRAGRAVLQYASDGYRSHWPDGVRIKAVLGLAPAGDDPGVDYRTTSMPVGLVYGTCDGASVYPDPAYFDPSAQRSSRPVYQWQIRGANHDYWNSQWSPSSGQVGAYDDAYPENRPPGTCADAETSSGPPDYTVTYHYVRQLSEYRQRHYGAVYIGDFFTASLNGDHHDAVLDGRCPLPGVVTRVHHGR